jgi:hypothetical protein
MKPGRNDPCPCGSGKKYKHCCYLTGQTESDMQDDDSYEDQDFMINAINNIRKFLLDRKPHIKEYYKIRNIHGDIANAMIKYHYDGKFKQQFDTDSFSEPRHEKKVYVYESDFDLDTREGGQAYYDMQIYKTASNASCITDDFIRNNRYRKPEKIEFLHSMLDSKLGLFEITGTDMENGYAIIKDVFTGAEYKIIDIGLSGQQHYDNYYLYTRIITYHGISFSTGLNFILTKDDNFIKNHIRQHKKDFNQNAEFQRFIQLYNYYSKHSNKVRVVTNKL